MWKRLTALHADDGDTIQLIKYEGVEKSEGESEFVHVSREEANARETINNEVTVMQCSALGDSDTERNPEFSGTEQQSGGVDVLISSDTEGSPIQESIRLKIESLSTLENVGETVDDFLDALAKDTENHEMLQGRATSCEGDDVKINLEKVRVILSSLNVDLQNAFDNYVCFQGERDERQMLRFLNTAYQRAEDSWTDSGVTDNGFSQDMLVAAKTKFFKLYNDHNKEIIAVEQMLAKEVVSRIMNENETKLKYCASNKHLSKADWEGIHQRMMEACGKIVGKSMRYGGKMNNVVLEETRTMAATLNSHYHSEVASNSLAHPSLNQSEITCNAITSPGEDKHNKPEQQNPQDNNKVIAQHSENAGIFQRILGGITAKITAISFGVLNLRRNYPAKTAEEEAVLPKVLLMNRCILMDRQLRDGTVQVGVVTKKIIFDAIELGMLAAEQDMVYCEEARNVNDLFKVHNFVDDEME